RAGSDCGNLLAQVSGGPGAVQAPGGAGVAQPGGPVAQVPGAARASDLEPPATRPCVLLCAHMDTVPLDAPVEPVVVDGFWENANDGILGADNKAAVAVLLALAQRVRRQGAPVDIELLFTVGEERSLAGARAFDASTLRSAFGYAFDHASPVGEVV